jgi:hypothetical protein
MAKVKPDPDSKVRESPVDVRDTRMSKESLALHKFSLIIAFTIMHSFHEFRYFVFHAGGLAISHALHPNKPEYHEDILLSLSSPIDMADRPLRDAV